MNSWYTIRARATGAEVAIYDEIGAHGVSAKGFLAELGALPEGTPIDLRLNSPSGSVFDAVAIYNAIKRHEGPVTVWIDGIAASAASYVAMAGDEIVMPENAFLMIHDPAGLVMGTADDMRAMADALDKVKGSLVQGYASKSGRDPQNIAALMAAETWFDAKEALDAGLATRIAEPVRIAARFDIARFRNAPPALIEAAEPDTPETVPEGNGLEGDPVVSGLEPDDIADDASADEQPGSAEGHVKHANMPAPASGAPADAAAIRAETIAHARAVIDLCRLARQPQMAGRFLEQNASLDEVRAALLAAKSDAEPEITPHHPQPGRKSAARPWGEIVARTFKLKG
ncbi:head maturation protease, ClpP-related [Aestuariivirga sp.]|uniref:head maturation protease, ClpP-related n=1 Tax=Aestuariivirga sp. TaxID=2650926 RepID=UPI003592FC26